ncbi:MAG: kynureninase [Pseudomonadota bacterium]
MTDFARTRACFTLPEGTVYLDGNSLGPLPTGVHAALEQTLRNEWGEMLITAWNRAGWMAQPAAVGDRIARLIGAPPGQTTVGDTLSIKVHQAVAAALQLRPSRKTVLSDTGNFPTDLYMVDGLINTIDRGHTLRTVAPDAVFDTIDESVAVVMLTHVDYRTGRVHDMASITRRAHDVGALVVWDLAHSAGALPLSVGALGVDFAVGCTYKYLNAGPGAPAFIYVEKSLSDALDPALSGWLGHDAPFAFEPRYRPAAGVERMRVGTPPVLAMAALNAALDVWEGVDLEDVRAQSVSLSERFIARVEAECPMLALASPRNAAERGSQVSFAFADGYAVMQALIARGVIGDFRAPDLLRFGFTPLYLGQADVDRACDVLAEVMATRAWDQAAYQRRATVT